MSEESIYMGHPRVEPEASSGSTRGCPKGELWPELAYRAGSSELTSQTPACRDEAGLRLQTAGRNSSARNLELVLAACLYYSGLVRLARWWTMRGGKKLVILCYHRASGGSLREHLRYLRRHYRLLHLESALEELYQASREKKQDHRPLLALTSDDGYHDLYSYGLPLARELQVPITVFLIPGYIESGKRFWWQEPAYLLQHTQLEAATFQGQIYDLRSPASREALFQAIHIGLHSAPSVARRQAFLESAYQALALPYPGEPLEQEQETLPLNRAEIHEMAASAWISFAAHTMHHPTLACLINPAESEYEVSECRHILEQQLGYPIRVFAYPVGKEGDFVARDRQIVEAAGYTWAVTAIHGLNTPCTDPLLLHRIIVDVDQHWLMVAAKASGLWDFLVHLGRIPVAFLRNMFK